MNLHRRTGGGSVEESPVVNEWIAEALGAKLLRLAAKRCGPVSADTEATIRAITDPKRVERMLERLLGDTDWADLLSTE
jgi:hypothetical protein